jgi:hypothetical protein
VAGNVEVIRPELRITFAARRSLTSLPALTVYELVLREVQFYALGRPVGLSEGDGRVSITVDHIDVPGVPTNRDVHSDRIELISELEDVIISLGVISHESNALQLLSGIRCATPAVAESTVPVCEQSDARGFGFISE